MYAVIETGGKQYKVAENQVVKLEKLDGNVGDVIQFDDVLALGSEGGVTLGQPTIDGAKVSAEVLDQKKDDKVIIFKKKRRQNYRRLKGHRQHITVVRILDVSGKGEVKKAKPAKKDVKPETKEKIEPKAGTKKDESVKAETKKEPKKETKKAAPKAEAKSDAKASDKDTATKKSAKTSKKES